MVAMQIFQPANLTGITIRCCFSQKNPSRRGTLGNRWQWWWNRSGGRRHQLWVSGSTTLPFPWIIHPCLKGFRSLITWFIWMLMMYASTGEIYTDGTTANTSLLKMSYTATPFHLYCNWRRKSAWQIYFPYQTLLPVLNQLGNQTEHQGTQLFKSFSSNGHRFLSFFWPLTLILTPPSTAIVPGYNFFCSSNHCRRCWIMGLKMVLYQVPNMVKISFWEPVTNWRNKIHLLYIPTVFYFFAATDRPNGDELWKTDQSTFHCGRYKS